MIQPKDIKLDYIVESFSSGFGRVNELLFHGIGVKYPHKEKEVFYSFKEIEEAMKLGNIKIHIE